MPRARTIGLTYDLREEQQPTPDSPPDYYGEFDSLENIQHLEAAISSLGYEVRLIGNARKLVAFLAAGERVDLVFNMAEGLYGRSREGQVPAILEAFNIPYTGSDPMAAGLCLDKAYAKRLWQHHGLCTARFVVAASTADCAGAAERIGGWPLFVKPLQDGSSKGIDASSVVHTDADLVARVEWLLRVYQQPVLIEAYLPGREFTVAIVGGGDHARVVGAMEVSTNVPGGVSGFLDKEQWEARMGEAYYTRLDEPPLADALGQLALAAYRALDCEDIGRVDLRCDAQGQPHIMEINPVPAMHPTHSAMTTAARHQGMSYEALLNDIIDHAHRRWGLLT